VHLGLRLLFAFVAITGLATVFLLRVFVGEIQPSVREVVEDLMVDTANLLAEVAAPELSALPAGSPAQADGPLAQAVRSYAGREVDARIWGLRKTQLDLRVYATDVTGRVIFDSGTPSAVGQDYSRWRDVRLTLRGEYGARTTRSSAGDDSAVMYVAAPVRSQDRIVGVLVVAKPMSTIAPFVERAEDKVLWAGFWLLGLSLAIGIAVTAWAVRSVRRLRHYAQEVGTSIAAPQPPALGGELGELAAAMDQMRARLDGRERLEHQVRALTHELKSPLAAIRGAAELLHDELAPADRHRFAAQVESQSLRLQGIVERMLELSRLEGLARLPRPEALDLRSLTSEVLAQHGAALRQRALEVRWQPGANPAITGDRDLLALALSNLVGNAIAHAPMGSTLDFAIQPDTKGIRWTLRDHGPGVPDYALPRLGEERFVDAGTGARGSGLGLAIVGQVVRLHGGRLAFEPAAPGLRASLHLPA
jgi:two-component system, OmpR family, sensor histidine kinase CreC